MAHETPPAMMHSQPPPAGSGGCGKGKGFLSNFYILLRKGPSLRVLYVQKVLKELSFIFLRNSIIRYTINLFLKKE